jgi:hypothetical protein
VVEVVGAVGSFPEQHELGAADDVEGVSIIALGPL